MGTTKGPEGLSLRWVIVIGVAVRLAFFFLPSLDFVPSILERRPELSTPTTSYMAVKEALYLQKVYKSSTGTLPPPYQSGNLYLPPIILRYLEPILSRTGNTASSFHITTALIWSIADAITAILLASIYVKKQKYLKRVHASPDQAQLDTSMLAGSALSSAGGIAAFFLFNPFSIATCLARSTTTFNNLALALAISSALSASLVMLGLGIVSAILISVYPVLLVPAITILYAMSASSNTTHNRSGKQTWSKGQAIICLFFIAATLALFVYVSYEVSGKDWTFIDRAYGTILFLPDLSPNIGLWWYFFIEIFDHFRDFFLLAFNVHVASYAIPLTIKYRQDPLFAITALTGLIAVLKSYPTLGDSSMFLSLLILHREISPYLRHSLFTTLLYTLATLMMPALHHLWLQAGSGNANFFYASTLVWALAGGSSVLDAMWAWGRWRWETERKRDASGNADRIATQIGKKKEDVVLHRKVIQA
ncbi:PIG-U-domain-containing protein [Meira miltonrushii]|uniref:PIG-U-domain-containing protein n=1 Tax=Meira miltonrushii TaxID=1280837 RepID=A0A316VF17_9BASI|nr:PIG-U-domain-containing protein [Meira miltonrushii]PWN35904.1 PIG-U-domain-containing protein [Meira miltonrushii]